MFERILGRRKPAPSKPVPVVVQPPAAPAITILDGQGRFVPPSCIDRVWIQPVNTAAGIAGYEVVIHIGGTMQDQIVYETCATEPLAQTVVSTILGAI